MIRRVGKWLRWDDEDEIVMTRVLGPDAASKGYAPPLASILKAASMRGVQLDKRCRRKLKKATRLRKRLGSIRRAEDVTPDGYPAHLVDRLFTHQRISLAYFEHRYTMLLGDQPGVGKTAPAIMWTSRRTRGPILVITPGRAKEQWAREIRRWSLHDEPTSVVEGRIPEQEATIGNEPGWIIGHWECMVHARDAILDRDWGAVILDEAHAIRNRDIKRTRTAHSLARRVPYRVAMTGHPSVNSPDEFWSILHFLSPDLYNSYWRFFSMHVLAKPKFHGGWDIKGTRSPKLLRWEIRSLALRRTKRQVWRSLPPVTRVAIPVELNKRQRAEYNRLKKDFFVELEQAPKDLSPRKLLLVPNVLARATRIRQYLIDPQLIGSASRSVKYPAVAELLEELDGPPVIFTSFRQAAERLQKYLAKKKRKTGLIAGGSNRSKKKRREQAKVQSRFLKGDYDALVVVTQAGGTAINLGKYGYVAFLDLPPTAVDLEQAEGRVDRPEEGTGKITPTTSYRVQVVDTHEQKREKKLEKKYRMFNEVFDPNNLEELFQ